MLWLIYQSSESNLDLSKAMITNGITTALAFTLLNNQKLAMKSTVAIANNTNNLNLKATNLTLTGTTPQQHKQVKGCQKHKKYHQNRSGLCPVE